MAYRTILGIIKWGIIVGLFILLIQYWLTTKSYVFSEEAVAKIAVKHIGPDHEKAYKKIYNEFKKQYPGHILPEKDLQWIFVNAGGWMGSMCLLHASLTEYVLFFGSAVDTVGHSGRYWANVSDTILTGTFRQWPEGSLHAKTHKPGETILHAWGEATSVNFAAGTWMVEYGRGFIPSTMGFALSDTLFSTQDFLTMYYTFRIYAKALTQEFGFYLSSLSSR